MRSQIISVIRQLIIPSLNPGETKIFEIPWNAPDPNNFICLGAEKNHICFLARIEGDAFTPGDHIEFPEVSLINSNVNYKQQHYLEEYCIS
jgi:hypothetical protein